MAAFSRRKAMVGAAFAALAGGVAATAEAASLDAALIAACATFMERNAEVRAWDDGLIDEADGETANAEWWIAVAAVLELPARTLEGLKAKAGVLERVVFGLCTDGGKHEDLAVALARDVMAFQGGNGKPEAWI